MPPPAPAGQGDGRGMGRNQRDRGTKNSGMHRGAGGGKKPPLRAWTTDRQANGGSGRTSAAHPTAAAETARQAPGTPDGGPARQATKQSGRGSGGSPPHRDREGRGRGGEQPPFRAIANKASALARRRRHTFRAQGAPAADIGGNATQRKRASEWGRPSSGPRDRPPSMRDGELSQAQTA